MNLHEDEKNCLIRKYIHEFPIGLVISKELLDDARRFFSPTTSRESIINTLNNQWKRVHRNARSKELGQAFCDRACITPYGAQVFCRCESRPGPGKGSEKK